jgi:hypothetical protein
MLVLSIVEHNYLVVDVCYLLHRYQLHVSALMVIFRLNELTKKHKQLYLACVLYTVEGVFIVWGYEISCVLSRKGGIWILLC